MMCLNRNIRQTIVDALIEHKFSEQTATLEARMAHLALKTYHSIYTTDVRKRAFADLPEEAFPTVHRLTVGTMTGARYLMFSGSLTPYRDLKAIRKPVFHRHASGVITISDTAIMDQVTVLWDDIKAYDEAVKEATASARATINGFYSSKDLLEAWPEIKPFVPPENKSARQLPVVQREALNARFDLPVETE